MNPLLEIRDLRAWYGASQALHGVDLHIEAGEAVALAGRNGSGRSTLAKAIMGFVRTQGVVRFVGQPLEGRRAFEIARLGIGYVPEQRDVFPTLTVHENLQLGLKPRNGRRAARFTLDDAHTLFPVLRERARTKAGTLSGGEQQMLSVARALLGDPDLIVIDEPTEGLAGLVVTQLAAALELLRERGVAMLLIEQRLVIADRIASRIAVMGHGEIVFDGSLELFRARPDVAREWLGVG
ncbi:amino acid/amide ABC transporter ATP-binding protein 2, HAAT family (TC 3.A.1.4.-) [Paraburkholderia steynii]|uniref:Amino acid/amide ABC transporter ATP-binding protein 2, HAAT family (TC 3.A.1.4.-) n=1 Tax=Paraburkholderia steynii TaxID=1245441 RepID=A0A7Z7B0B1_9BURK|nr:ABC transporter ATP-binding protein [Paraburkholderia steynii]SDG96829.1 amino acid/amide ABC transporter ATP-binding protein 2, HAAT family (TC 3.A.1.4.-) [Paraburkholderia steynii]